MPRPKGICGSFLYLGLRRWLPARPLFRGLCFALITLGLGLTATINGNEVDFVFVNTAVSIGAFACVLLVYGLLVPRLLDRLAPRTASGSRWGRGLMGAVLVLSVVSGTLAVRRAFEIADGALVGLPISDRSDGTRTSDVRRDSSVPVWPRWVGGGRSQGIKRHESCTLVGFGHDLSA